MAFLSQMFSVSRPSVAAFQWRSLTRDLALGGYDVYKGPRNLDPAVVSGAQWPVNEPLAVVPAMAAATKNIGFGVTVTTSYEQPYHLARRLSTVDHLTKGRYVNLVTVGRTSF
jgi:alkanesulfonate monooxygenase SsuD/methylene tetrahydromethanopterin reductase-like flavin-dependent oxidoreductase (luciferase family)